MFDYEDLGPVEIRGLAAPVTAARVLRESSAESRFEALRSEAAPLIGRDQEFDLLLRHWAEAKAGEGRAVLISGEPGIGKSRLTAALSQALDEERYGSHEGYIAAVKNAAVEEVKSGFLLPEDADRLMAEARASSVLK